MRLTLRTLLAFIDDVLEPADRDEIANKLETSDFANDLIHRTKDTVRRLRLSAPQVTGTGIGLDPNTVAEYLDNTLPPDNVADFERICLESDVHLAEVTSCHHVLTMVLGEPAEVDPASRQRMYLVPTSAAEKRSVRFESAHPAPGAGNVPDESTAAQENAPPGGLSTATVGSHSAGIPDYLRASGWSTYRLPLAALAAILLVAVTALLTFGIIDWFGGERQFVAGSADPTATGEGANDGLTADASRATESETSLQLTNQTTGGGEKSPHTQMEGSPPPPLTPGFAGFDTTSEEADRSATNLNSVPPPREPARNDDVDRYRIPQSEPNADAITGIPPAAELPAVSIDEAQPEVVDVPQDADQSNEMRIASANVGTPPGATPDLGVDATATINVLADSDAVEHTVEEIVELGTYLDGKNILLRHDPSVNAWYRMLPRSTVGVGDKVLALPTFYPRITFTSGIHLKLAGGTLVSLGLAESSAGDNKVSARRVPAVDVAFGQMVIINTADQDNEMQLSLGEMTATIRFVPGATLAIDVMRSYVPGLDPRQSPSPLVANFYVPDGSVHWEDERGGRSIQAPSRWDMTAGVMSDVSTLTNFPDWIDSEPVERRSEQRYGAPVVEQSLDATRPVENQLLELYQGSRQREVKSLVARSSVYVGLFVPFVEALRDSDQSAMWKTHIETLRAAMALGPESAEKIYQTLVEQRGETAARDLYEMLCGYDQDQVGRTPEQVATGPIPRLIDWLESDSLDYRVFAVQNLWEVRHKRLLTNPAGSPLERAQGVRRWRQRLKSGELDASPE